MLTRFFHRWEHQLASVSTDRVVRPFDWGLDWIPVNGHGDAAPKARVHAWVDELMRDTSEFFDDPPTRAYQFNPAGPQAAAKGEAGTLRFPSALVTPHPENNTVVARWFPAPGEPGVDSAGPRGRAVVVLPQWNSDAEGHIGLSRLLARFGISALRLSLPYHDARMPPELTRADYIVSANVVRTVQVCRQAVLDARRAVAWLANQLGERGEVLKAGWIIFSGGLTAPIPLTADNVISAEFDGLGTIEVYGA